MMAHARSFHIPRPYAFYRQWDGNSHNVTYFDSIASLCEATRNNEPVRKVWVEHMPDQRNMWDVYGESMLTDQLVWLGVLDKDN